MRRSTARCASSKRAQAAGTDGNWQRALLLLDEYAGRFPPGRLADVRAVAHL
jgi:hypothetical protein